MSGKAGSIGSMVVGAVLIAVGVLQPEISWLTVAQGVLLLGAGAYSMTLSAQGNSPDALRSQDLQIATIAEGTPIPVIFGTQKITGNFMNYSKSTFRAEEITQDRGGGKGGGGGSGAVVGYDYYLQYEYGLCMGPVDGIDQVFSVPGEIPMMATHPAVASTSWLARTQSTFAGMQMPGAQLTVYFDDVSSLVVGSKVQIGPSGNLVFNIISVDAVNSRAVLQTINGFGAWMGIYPGYLTYAYRPDLNSNVKLKLDSTAHLAAGDSIVIDTSGKYQVVSVDDATHATCKLLEAYNSPFIAPTLTVTKSVDPSAVFTSDDIEIELASEHEGGTVRVYRGSPTQTRISTGDSYASTGMNYRNICWALHGVGNGFHIGINPTVKTYQYVLRRYPRVNRNLTGDTTDLTTLGFEVKGSGDPTHRCYKEANPAAIVYEVLTNKIWGRGLPSDIINEASFIAASQYFWSKNIGMSMTIDQPDKVADLLQELLRHVKTILVWDGETLKMKVLLDTGVTHATIRTLTRSQVIAPKFSRPTWHSTFNEVRAEFTNYQKNYRSDVVAVQDLANFGIVGVINPQRISLNAFTNPATAREQSARMLQEASYPLGVLTFQMNRFASDLEPGDVFRFIWDEWSATVVTSYFIVTSIKDGSSSADAMEVSAVEDISLSGVASEEDTVSAPGQQPWEYLASNPITGDSKYVAPVPDENAVLPIGAFELPPILTEGKSNSLIVTGQKGSTNFLAISVFWGKQPATTYYHLKDRGVFSITGKLLSEAAQTLNIDRSSEAFQFSLTDVADEGTILGANLVQSDADDIEKLILNGTDYILIDDEIIQAGFIEKLGTNHYRARNVIRGRFGTAIRRHFIGASVFYFHSLPTSVIDANAIPENFMIAFRGYPVYVRGEKKAGGDFFISRPDDSTDAIFIGAGKRPLAPEPLTATKGAQTIDIVVRPRFADHGAGIGDFQTSMQARNADLGGVIYAVQPFDSSGNAIDRKIPVSMVERGTGIGLETTEYIEATGTFVPDDAVDRNAGVVRISYTPSPNFGIDAVRTVRVFASKDGRFSAAAAEFIL